jgi:Na+/proline symporter
VPGIREGGNTQESVIDKTPATVLWLGRAGLLPFIGLAAALYLDGPHQQLWLKSIATYTLVIICFLVGAWWGLALMRRSPAALLMSNAVVLVAFFGYVLMTPPHFLLLGTFLFLVTVLVERRHALFFRQPRYYARMRLQLSLVASASLLLAAMDL